MSELKVNKISPRSGTAVTLGDSGDTFTIPSGATLAIAGTVTGFTSAGIDDNATSVAITIDSSERVGIGTTSPSEKLEVRDGKLLVKTTSGAATIEIVSPGGTSDSVLNFGDSADNNVGAIAYEHDNNAFRFLANVAERMRLDSSGRLLVGKTNTARTTVGSEIRGDGFIRGTKSGGHSFDAVRTSDQGDAIRIYSENNLVGVLGTEKWGIGTASPSHTLDVVGDAEITTADNSDTLTLTSTDADAAVGPNLKLYRNSGSPADNDSLGQIFFVGRNDNSQDFTAFQMNAYSTDVSDGTEDGTFRMYAMQAGSQHIVMQITPTETVFNDGSVDQNFRVESDGNANMLFVDGGTNRVGIGTNAPGATLETIGTAGNNFKYATSGAYFSILPEAPNGNVSLRFRANSGSAPDLIFKNDGASEVVRIGNSGNVGIGTSNTTTAKVFIEHAGAVDDNGLYVYSNIGQTVPLVKIIQDGAGSNAPAVYIRNDDADGIALHLEKGNSNVTPLAFANQLFIEDDANTGLTIGSPTNGVGSVVFGDSGDADIAKFQYYHDGDSMRFTVNAAERMRIHSNGVLSATAGIALGVGTANTASNVLDDYETGTWTPAFSGISSVGYNVQSGNYIKVGGLVFFELNLQTNAGTGANTRLKITGLPFQPSGSKSGNAAIGYVDNSFVNSTTVNLPTMFFEPAGIEFYVSDGTQYTANLLNDPDSINLYISGTYRTG